MTAISDEFIDVDFETQPEYVFGNLGARLFGDCETYGDKIETIPESQWDELIEKMDSENSGIDALVTRIYNQMSEGSCVANACSQAHEILQAAQFGTDNVVHLSAISLYKRIGRSPGSGAMLDDGLDEMSKRGILPLDNAENRDKFGEHVMPNTGFYTQYPSGWGTTAAKFRATEWFILRSVAELVTAGLKGHPIVVGRSGHSICYCRPMYDSRDRMVFKYANSWGNWGDQGYGYDSLNMIRASANWAFACRSIVVPT